MALSGSAPQRLVDCMERVDRVVTTFLEELGRAVAGVRAEVAAERDAHLAQIEQASASIAAARADVDHERAELARVAAAQRAELERAWAELSAGQARAQAAAEGARAEKLEAEAMLRVLTVQQQQAVQAAAVMSAAQQGQMAASWGQMMPRGGPAGIGGSPPAAGYASGGPGDADGGWGGSAGGFGSAGPPGTGASSSPASLHASSVIVLGGLERANAPVATASLLEVGDASATWRALPALPTPRGYLAVAAAAQRAAGGAGGIFAIGGSHGSAPLASVDELVLSEGHAPPRWRPAAPMATPRIWLGAASVGDLVFAMGGYDGAHYLSVVEVLDAARAEHARAAGGADPADRAAASGSGGGGEGAWKTMAPMPQGRSTLGCVGLANVVYAVGGFGPRGGGGGASTAPPTYLASCDAFDPMANRWWPVANLKGPRRDLALGTLPDQGLLMALGGYDGQMYLSTVEALDPRTGAWMPRAPLGQPRQLLAAASAGGSIYALGGFDGKAAVGTVEIYDARMDQWRPLAPLPQPRLGLGAVGAL